MKIRVMIQNHSRKKLGESVWFEINVTNKDQEEERRAAKILLMLWAVFGVAQQIKREKLGFQIEVRAINRAELSRGPQRWIQNAPKARTRREKIKIRGIPGSKIWRSNPRPLQMKLAMHLSDCSRLCYLRLFHLFLSWSLVHWMLFHFTFIKYFLSARLP